VETYDLNVSEFKNFDLTPACNNESLYYGPISNAWLRILSSYSLNWYELDHNSDRRKEGEVISHFSGVFKNLCV